MAKSRRLNDQMDNVDEMGEEQQLDDIQEETLTSESKENIKDNLHAALV